MSNANPLEAVGGGSGFSGKNMLIISSSSSEAELVIPAEMFILVPSIWIRNRLPTVGLNSIVATMQGL